MLVAFAEGLAAAKVYATRDRYSIDVDRELVALGATNLGSGLSSGMVVGGSLSKTAVNAEAGAATQLSGLVAAALVVVTLLLFTNLFQSLPEATLAAIVIAALVRLVDVRSVAQLYRLTTPRLSAAYGIASRPDFFAGVTALLGVLVLDVLAGLFVGIVVSLLLLVYRASRPSLSELGRVPGRDDVYADPARHPDAVPVPGIAVLRVDGELFFANASAVRARIEAAASEPGIDAVVLDLESVPLIDVTAGRVLMELGTDLAHGGIHLAIARRVDPAGLELVRTAAGEEAARRVYPTVADAIRACEARRTPSPDEPVPAPS
jgi:anti-anti-sigma factor